MPGGSVEDVEAVLDAWNVARSRNPITGDIAHPPLTFLLDAEGTIAFATVSGRKTVAVLIGKLWGRPPPQRVGTTSTGTVDLRITPAETLPTTRSNSFPRPCEPTTITSASSFSACSRIVCTVGPCTMSALTS